ncbi:MAG: DinB family protein [Cyclobacteriaceae bacterium]
MKRSKTAQRLIDNIVTAKSRMLATDETNYKRKPSLNKWSPIEILGHLIDSAANNLPRFLSAGNGGKLIFQTYPQDDLVALQDYQNGNWKELVEFWAAFNLHMAKLIDLIPEEIRSKEHTEHNLHKIAFIHVLEGEPTTLQYLIDDYVVHLEHHLKQMWNLTSS